MTSARLGVLLSAESSTHTGPEEVPPARRPTLGKEIEGRRASAQVTNAQVRKRIGVFDPHRLEASVIWREVSFACPSVREVP